MNPNKKIWKKLSPMGKALFAEFNLMFEAEILNFDFIPKDKASIIAHNLSLLAIWFLEAKLMRKSG